MRFPGAPVELVEVRWFETDKPFLDKSTVYNSLNWCEPRDAKTFPAGEADGRPRPWVNGAQPGSIGPGPPLGSEDAWLGETAAGSPMFEVGEACWFDFALAIAIETDFGVGELLDVVEDLAVEELATIAAGDGVVTVEDLAVEELATIAAGDGVVTVEDLAVEELATIVDAIGLGADLAVEVDWAITPNIDQIQDLAVEWELTPPLDVEFDLAVEFDGSPS